MKNDPAFPISNQEQQDAVCRAGASPYGMTLRDYFAAKAMQGLLAGGSGQSLRMVIIAELAYEQADDMLKARTQ